MTAHRSVKEMSARCRIVGVITSAAELRLATQMKRPPDLFELRLDYFSGLETKLEAKISRLPAPLIITARHPAEGGANNLSARLRGDLILRFLPRAQYVDIELRSTNALASVLQRVRRAGVGCILSFHHFGLTPSARSLHAKAKAAQALDALVFKVATRTDTADQLAPLLLFMAKKNPRLRVAAMGVGKLGAVSRLALAQCGSVFAYASIAQPRVEGQLSVEKLRSAFETLQIR